MWLALYFYRQHWSKSYDLHWSKSYGLCLPITQVFLIYT